MAKKHQPEQTFTAYDGSERSRRFQTRYWFDRRTKHPSPFGRGAPKTEDGSMEGVGKLVLKGWISKAQCFDWKNGTVKWTIKRGDKVPGTNVYTVEVYAGDPDA